MKAIIDKLSDELSERYLLYIERIAVDAWSEDGQIELRCGFTLRSDHYERAVIFKLPATLANIDTDREAVLGAVFKQFEILIDREIADDATKN